MSSDKYATVALYLVPGATPGLKAEIARALERAALDGAIEELIEIRDWLCPGCVKNIPFSAGEELHNGYSQEDQVWCKASYLRQIITARRAQLTELDVSKGPRMEHE